MQNNSFQKLKIAALYRGRLSDPRGTPIRVRNILSLLSMESDLDLTVFSWDTGPSINVRHVQLYNRHFKESFEFIRFIHREKISIVIGHSISAWPYLLLAKLFTRAKIVLEMHGFMEEESFEYGDIGIWRYRLSRNLSHVFYAICDLITTCGAAASDEISRYNSRVVTLFGGVDLKLFREDVPRATYVPLGGILIGYAGNLRKWQGVEFLISSFKRLKPRHPEYRLAILSSEGRKFINDPDIEVYPTVLPEEVPAFLSACDILVIPRPYTRVNHLSYPSKLSEFMAMGKPVVASSNPDCEKILSESGGGLLYPPGDEEALLERLLRLNDPELRKILGAHARDYAEHFLSWSRQVELFADSLRKTVCNEPVRRP